MPVIIGAPMGFAASETGEVGIESCEQHVDCAELLRAFCAGESNQLHVQFDAMVRRTLNRYGVYSTDEDDVSQMVWLLVFQRAKQLEDPQCFPGWIRSIARNTTINYLQRRRLYSGGDSVIESCISREELPEQAAVRRETQQQIRVSMNALKPSDRKPLHAFYFEGKSLLEMTRKEGEVDIPLGTVKRRVFVGRQRLKRLLEEQSSSLVPESWKTGGEV